MVNTSIVELWAPVVIFAHLFASFWFIRLFLLHDPRALRVFQRRRRSSNEKLPKARNSEDDECREGNEDIVLTMDKQRQVVILKETKGNCL